MGRFFPHADIADIIANMRPGTAPDGGYNATFTYPAGGAIQYVHALLLPDSTVAAASRSWSVSARTGHPADDPLGGSSSAPLPALRSPT
jgi:hypothetical protein